MAKYKVGDKVRLTGSDWQDVGMSGLIVEITDMDKDGDGVFEFEGSHWSVTNQESDGYWSGAGELVEAASTSGEIRMTSATGGQKGSKTARFDLIPTEPLWMLAELYGKGAEKYDDDNWRKGYDWKYSYAAAQRHLNQFWDGEDIDPEMQLPHVISAAWHCFTLAQFMIDHREYDPRAEKRKYANDQDS